MITKKKSTRLVCISDMENTIPANWEFVEISLYDYQQLADALVADYLKDSIARKRYEVKR